MKSKSKATPPGEPKLRMFIRGFPIWVRNGKLIDPEIQVQVFLKEMFAAVEASGNTVHQAKKRNEPGGGRRASACVPPT